MFVLVLIFKTYCVGSWEIVAKVTLNILLIECRHLSNFYRTIYIFEPNQFGHILGTKRTNAHITQYIYLKYH